MQSTLKAAQITGEIDKLWSDLLRCRTMFPYLLEGAIGCTSFDTALFYQQHGHNVRFVLDAPLTAEMREEINAIGHWINQNYVVWLYALLESHKVVSKKVSIDKHLEGHEEVSIVRRLRNKFAHSAGRYDPCDSDARKLHQTIVTRFSLDAEDPQRASQFPIPIDKVLRPLTDGCKRYVRAFGEPESRT